MIDTNLTGDTNLAKQNRMKWKQWLKYDKCFETSYDCGASGPNFAAETAVCSNQSTAK